MNNNDKELDNENLRLFNKNIAFRINIKGTSCPVSYGFNGCGIPDRAKVA